MRMEGLWRGVFSRVPTFGKQVAIASSWFRSATIALVLRGSLPILQEQGLWHSIMKF
jgi:hypothetical protein